MKKYAKRLPYENERQHRLLSDTQEIGAAWT